MPTALKNPSTISMQVPQPYRRSSKAVQTTRSGLQRNAKPVLRQALPGGEARRRTYCESSSGLGRFLAGAWLAVGWTWLCLCIGLLCLRKAGPLKKQRANLCL